MADPFLRILPDDLQDYQPDPLNSNAGAGNVATWLQQGSGNRDAVNSTVTSFMDSYEYIRGKAVQEGAHSIGSFSSSGGVQNQRTMASYFEWATAVNDAMAQGVTGGLTLDQFGGGSTLTDEESQLVHTARIDQTWLGGGYAKTPPARDPGIAKMGGGSFVIPKDWNTLANDVSTYDPKTGAKISLGKEGGPLPYGMVRDLGTGKVVRTNWMFLEEAGFGFGDDSYGNPDKNAWDGTFTGGDNDLFSKKTTVGKQGSYIVEERANPAGKVTQTTFDTKKSAASRISEAATKLWGEGGRILGGVQSPGTGGWVSTKTTGKINDLGYDTNGIYRGSPAPKSTTTSTSDWASQSAAKYKAGTSTAASPLKQKTASLSSADWFASKSTPKRTTWSY